LPGFTAQTEADRLHVVPEVNQRWLTEVKGQVGERVDKLPNVVIEGVFHFTDRMCIVGLVFKSDLESVYPQIH
jgi:hypothetical protein